MGLFNKKKITDDTTETLPSITLHDLLCEKLDIFCWCNRCNYNNVIKTTQIIERLGANYPVPKIGLNLRCSKCNNTHDISTRPNWPSHGGQIARHMD